MSISDVVDQRTKLAGTNRMELLLFRLGSKQLYGINVFKIKEIIQNPRLNRLPGARDSIAGVSHIRGFTMPIIDLMKIIEKRYDNSNENQVTICTEYNRSSQAFLVSSVVKITNVHWDDIHSLPAGSGKSTFLTAVTKVDDEIIEILDVEKILDQFSPKNRHASSELIEASQNLDATNKQILICDDSSIARKQVVSVLKDIVPQAKVVVLENGKDAHDFLVGYSNSTNENVSDHILMLISDIEMPKMDGYMLTTEIRRDERLKDLFIVLHSSLSGAFNRSLIEKVGADEFVPKFDANVIGRVILDRLIEVNKMANDEQSK